MGSHRSESWAQNDRNRHALEHLFCYKCKGDDTRSIGPLPVRSQGSITSNPNQNVHPSIPSPVTRKFKVMLPGGQGVMSSFQKSSPTINVTSYCLVQCTLKDFICRKQPGSWKENYCSLLTMAEPMQHMHSRKQFGNSNGNSLIICPIKIDLTLSDFHLFGPMTEHLGGKHLSWRCRGSTWDITVATTAANTILHGWFSDISKVMDSVYYSYRGLCEK